MAQHSFYVDKANGKFLGVCAGVSDYFDVDVTLIRIATAVGTLVTGFFPIGLIYLAIAWIAPDRATIG